MSIFKCKICGGDLEISFDSSIAVCQYCGTKQTLPHLSDERRANLYDRANHFRRNNDYDKAMAIYEQILSEDTTDAEAYWSIILCRYGIEYVKDGSSNRYLPTVNRMQYTSVYDDEDYKSAIQNADAVQREIYEADAREINNIQKEILSISQKEEPFDVFICYKETDVNGRRTQGSVLATELYHELTKEGFKVFFSRITLEDKLGTAYEPYIFAALNSAKVMVVLGTKTEHFNSVWVKNEWSRYLALIKNGAKKTLIPAYRDMDPYDLPEEFSHLQAQDMSKLGFMQDLTRGIKKILEVDAPAKVVKETVIQAMPSANIAPLLKRAFMFLEDGEFERADEFCEQVLNQDPGCAEAYLGKLMVELKVKRPAELQNCAEPFDGSKNYQKAIRFADNELSVSLKGYLYAIRERNARKAEEERKEAEEKRLINEREAAQNKIDVEIKKRKAKKVCVVLLPIICVCVAFVVIFKGFIIPNNRYQKAIDLLENGKYYEAYEIFCNLGSFKDSNEKSDQLSFSKYQVGDSVLFGYYEQNGDSTLEESIEWVVIKKEKDKVLLLSKLCLDYLPYNKYNVNTTWETCSLRSYLNGDFYSTAFSEKEKSQIICVNNQNASNSEYSTHSGNDTQDSVFLLSESEQFLLWNKEFAKTSWTSYAAKKLQNKSKKADWWLRTPGETENRAMWAWCDTSLFWDNGAQVDVYLGVRPAIWIGINSMNN